MSSELRQPYSRLLALAILIGLVTAVFWGVAEPIQQRYQYYDESIALKLDLISRYRAQAVDPEALEQQRTAAQQADASQAGLLRGTNDAVAAAYIQQLVTSTVEAQGGTMRSVQIIPAKDQDGFRRITLRAQMNLTTKGLHGALYRIEASQPFLFVDNLDIRQGQQRRPKDDGYEESLLLVRFDVYGFVRPPAPPAQGS